MVANRYTPPPTKRHLYDLTDRPERRLPPDFERLQRIIRNLENSRIGLSANRPLRKSGDDIRWLG